MSGEIESRLRPSQVCARLLSALEASEGRRRRRKRDTRPDAIGLRIKRWLLEAAVEEDPAPENFEGWLMERCQGIRPELGPSGSIRAIAREIYSDWRMVLEFGGFREWLDSGAPSADAGGAG